MENKLARRFFEWMDHRYHKSHQVFLIPTSEINCFLIEKVVYKGQTLQLADGTLISKGDLLAEMHVDNQKMSQIETSDIRQMLRIIDHEIKAIGLACKQEHPAFDQVKAVYGRTVLYPLVVKKGFEIREMPSGMMKIFLSYWDNLIKVVFSSQKNKKFKRREPKEIWMSRKTIIGRLGE